ncbi:isoleucyl-tRNA synthetase [Staphylococcus aureus]|uniref:Isoleucyl-tRNA synthetase n=1 Tax=Staphylococcus aureus TaxID=1280 RepID=A0A380E117_STAAU|nr:isoleucyl-tRNA synthetase [Staphylococcus aureus]
MTILLVKKYELPVISPIDDKGVFTEEGGQFEGNVL